MPIAGMVPLFTESNGKWITKPENKLLQIISITTGQAYQNGVNFYLDHWDLLVADNCSQIDHLANGAYVWGSTN